MLRFLNKDKISHHILWQFNKRNDLVIRLNPLDLAQKHNNLSPEFSLEQYIPHTKHSSTTANPTKIDVIKIGRNGDHSAHQHRESVQSDETNAHVLDRVQVLLEVEVVYQEK